MEWADIKIWFKKYREVLDQMQITTPDRIFNIDEHGTEHHAKTKKVVGKKNCKSFQIQYGEKPARSTMLTYVRADGVAYPPMVIHKGRVVQSWKRDCPEGACLIDSDNVTLKMYI